jgi:hypothetical protein
MTARGAQASTSGLRELVRTAGEAADETELIGYDVLLKPGDVLYVPPFWFHATEVEAAAERRALASRHQASLGRTGG